MKDFADTAAKDATDTLKGGAITAHHFRLAETEEPQVGELNASSADQPRAL